MVEVGRLDEKRSIGLAEKVAQRWSMLLACCWKQKETAAPVMSNISDSSVVAIVMCWRKQHDMHT